MGKIQLLIGLTGIIIMAIVLAELSKRYRFYSQFFVPLVMIVGLFESTLLLEIISLQGGEILSVIGSSCKAFPQAVKSIPYIVRNFPDALDTISLPLVIVVLISGTIYLWKGGKR
ncbi:MAG: hypothetical protein DRH33_00910 [Candidatus Nealsonbacteria bacterium]|nr:MAG: hypothetical protein DRH33_00910 [Candidatus Nealsonbacteria bacterium]